MRTGDLVLVKGSRGVRLEKIIQKLRDEFELLREGMKYIQGAPASRRQAMRRDHRIKSGGKIYVVGKGGFDRKS